MAIWLDENTRVLTQGITGRNGAFHTRQCLAYGAKIVAGATPGKGGETFDGKIPVFDGVHQALKEVEAEASMIFVPAPAAADAIMEAADAGIKLIVCITEGIPVLDMVRVKRFLVDHPAILIGPNCPGIISAERSKLGIMPGYIHKRGNIGVVSRSGTLTYEAVYQLSAVGLGQSTCVGIGGDPVHGVGFIDVLKAFQEDPETEGIILIGEIGGSDEEEAAAFVKENVAKPVVAFVAGRTAPAGKRMGHAGAIIMGSSGTAAHKIETFERCGIRVAENPAVIGETMKRALDKAKK
jgi:succinyl-CoA synthetase alpha subunit